MDTRKKIVTAAGVCPCSRPRKIIIGYFDPFWAPHARRLAELCSPDEQIIVAIDDPPSPLSTFRARAEVLAGVSGVDYVVAAQDVDALRPAEIVDERQDDILRAASLATRVRDRHNTR